MDHGYGKTWRDYFLPALISMHRVCILHCHDLIDFAMAEVCSNKNHLDLYMEHKSYLTKDRAIKVNSTIVKTT